MCEYSCDMTHTYVCDMTFSYSPWSKERTLHRTWHESHNSFRISVTYFIHVWDLARHVTLSESCHMWMRHVTYEHVMSREASDPRLLVSYKWVMSHMNESCHTHRDHQRREKKVISHINKSFHKWMSHITCEWVISHINESCHIWKSHVTCQWVMSHTNESCHI